MVSVLFDLISFHYYIINLAMKIEGENFDEFSNVVLHKMIVTL